MLADGCQRDSVPEVVLPALDLKLTQRGLQQELQRMVEQELAVG